MQVQVKIDDTIWDEFIKLGEAEENIHQITETALISHINKLKAYKDLLPLEGKAKWEGDLDELRENRI
jgi:hypothetical protein